MSRFDLEFFKQDDLPEKCYYQTMSAITIGQNQLESEILNCIKIKRLKLRTHEIIDEKKFDENVFPNTTWLGSL